jgi:hypothetical protein
VLYTLLWVNSLGQATPSSGPLLGRSARWVVASLASLSPVWALFLVIGFLGSSLLSVVGHLL